MGKENKKLKKMKKLLCLLAILMPMLSVDCFAQDKIVLTQEDLNRMEESRKKRERGIEAIDDLENRHCQMFAIQRAPQFQFQNLKGLNINIVPSEYSPRKIRELVPLAHASCVIMPTVGYIKAMGFDDIGENEHTLNIYVQCLNAFVGAQEDLYTQVSFTVEITNRDSEVIFEQEVGSTITPFKSGWDVFRGFNEAYTQSLEKINWYKIASFLKESSTPKQQVKQESKEVKGYGNTDLENTIVRWDVQSRPAGADVFWRVVSKTPSVKSTNNKYLQTTPYEATKSLDIRGLSYENSGDVRVILRCEKEGYYPQEKEFNVRMIIDQEEISAFFKLVKVE